MNKTFVKNACNVLIGIAVGILIHYFLYRFSLPTKSFIYAAF